MILEEQIEQISIHALLAESDSGTLSDTSDVTAISIHALLAESDLLLCPSFMPSQISIHALLAESDPVRYAGDCTATHFYPRSPCGERHSNTRQRSCRLIFLSTLSLRRATFGTLVAFFCQFYFYPRSPCGERRGWFRIPRQVCYISIHALLAESDHIIRRAAMSTDAFLSTLSLRRATAGIIH